MTSAKGSVITSVYLSVSKVTQNVMNRFLSKNPEQMNICKEHMITSSSKDHAQKALIIKPPMLCYGTKNLINKE